MGPSNAKFWLRHCEYITQINIQMFLSAECIDESWLSVDNVPFRGRYMVASNQFFPILVGVLIKVSSHAQSLHKLSHKGSTTPVIILIGVSDQTVPASSSAYGVSQPLQVSALAYSQTRVATGNHTRRPELFLLK